MQALKKINNDAEPEPQMTAQGILYLVGGLWPIIHFRSFKKVTGARSDPAMLRVFGGIMAVTGGMLLFAGNKARKAGIETDLSMPENAAAGAMAAADLALLLRGRVSPLQILSAGFQVVMAVRRIARMRALPPSAANRQALSPELS